MKQITTDIRIVEVALDELIEAERRLIHLACQATQRSYAPYSNFHVGAAILLGNGVEMMGCNQENAAFSCGICAERSALFAAGAQYPDQPVKMLAIAASTKGAFTEEPVSPCGHCRQAIVEAEQRAGAPIRILLYGSKKIYVMDGIRNLMPLTFTNF